MLLLSLSPRAKEEEVYGGMTFAPSIDPLSRAMGRTRGLQELVDNKAGQKVRVSSLNFIMTSTSDDLHLSLWDRGKQRRFSFPQADTSTWSAGQSSLQRQ